VFFPNISGNLCRIQPSTRSGMVMGTLLNRFTCESIALAVAATVLFVGAAQAQTPQARIAGEIDNAERATLPGSHSPLARAEFETGRMPAGTPIAGISIVFKRLAEQEADLQALLTAQQDPGSPQYHKWLTPEEFAGRYGVADADVAKVEFWLQQQGFNLDGRSRSNNRIHFSGTAEQVEFAFGTEMHYYMLNGAKHFAPSTELSVPAALASVVETVGNLATFKPTAHVRYGALQQAPRPDFTSSQTSNHFLTPADIATIYDIKAAYNAGFTGTGQSIAVMGQSSIAVSDIENFESAAGLAKKDPTMLLVPGSGTATITTGDESESDLDLEYSGGTAPGATIIFVFVGNSPNFGVFDSLQFAIENKTAPVITISYGSCESDLGSGEYTMLNGVLAQAAVQGQTVVSASGDNGSEDCFGDKDQSTTAQEALAVDFPASSQFVTGMGGTEFPAADVATTNTTFWTPASGADVIGSAKSYIPEMVWNDDSAAGGLSSGGGGASTLTARPSWQTGVPGITAGNFRLVPDISLTASPNNAGFLYCSSDTQDTGITGSCANGFRDSSVKNLTLAGGTSFDAPIFAGMVAIINEKINSGGQGVVNSTLYKLAGNATTYASAFHDITSGSNECSGGATSCSVAGAASFAAGTGYDEASGLGSVDFFKLLNAWPGSATATPVASTTALSAATTTPASGASDAIKITVASGSSSSMVVPTGIVTPMVDGNMASPSLTLSNGVATFSFVSNTAGAHIVTANYSGDGTYSASSGSVNLTVESSATKSFVLSVGNATVAAGSSGSSTVTVTPENGYSGTVAFTVTSSPAVANACFSVPSLTVSTSSAVMSALTIATSSGLCGSAAVVGGSGSAHKLGGVAVLSWLKNISGFNEEGIAATHPVSLAVVTGLALSGMFLVGLLSLRSRRLVAVWALVLVATVACGITGCSSAGSSSSTPTNTSTNAVKGSFTLTVTGTDTANSSVKASTTLTLTID
jgi:subtilase family serine protease